MTDGRRHDDANGYAPGFTLVEVVISLAIFAVGILAVGTMQLTAMKSNTTADVHTQTVTKAVDRMERWMASPYQGANETVSMLQRPYRITRSVKKAYVAPNTEAIKILIERNEGMHRDVTLECIKADTI